MFNYKLQFRKARVLFVQSSGDLKCLIRSNGLQRKRKKKAKARPKKSIPKKRQTLLQIKNRKARKVKRSQKSAKKEMLKCIKVRNGWKIRNTKSKKTYTTVYKTKAGCLRKKLIIAQWFRR